MPSTTDWVAGVLAGGAGTMKAVVTEAVSALVTELVSSWLLSAGVVPEVVLLGMVGEAGEVSRAWSSVLNGCVRSDAGGEGGVAAARASVRRRYDLLLLLTGSMGYSFSIFFRSMVLFEEAMFSRRRRNARGDRGWRTLG
jgi:hypothetical protein